MWADEVGFEVPAHASRLVHRFEPEGAPDRFVTVRGGFPGNRHFFAAVKDLEREPGRLEHQIEPGDGGCRVQLRADTYAYFVHLDCPDEDVRFEDNYLELAPGEERVIAVTGASEVHVRAR